MTPREKKLLLVVACLGLVGVAYAGYEMIYGPLQRNRAEQAKLLDEMSEKQAQYDKMMTDLRRLPAAKKRSLPAETDVAKREYEAALGYLLRSNGVPAGYTIVPKDGGDVRSIPDIAPKKPAYQRIGYDIRLQKVDLPTVVKVLKAYYDLNLLQQITALDIKRVEKEGSSGGFARRGSDRADLEVTLHTDAIILDGAEHRRTLISVPIAFAAAGGIGGYQAVLHMPESGRGIKTQQFASLLAKDPREYLVMEARDVFHGPLPPPRAIEVEVPKENVFKKAPPEDIAPYIRLNAITTSTTGVKEAIVWDTATNHYYEINLRDDDTPSPEFQFIKKYKLGEKWKNIDYSSWKPLGKSEPFMIGEETTATHRTFNFLGYFEDGLLLKETVTLDPPKDEEPKAKVDPKKGAAKAPAIREKATASTKPTKEQQATTAAVGGLAMTKPASVERFYLWRLGQTLASLEESKALTEADAMKLLAKGPAKEPAAAELAPSPRSSN